MFLDYRAFKLDGVKNIKERIILLIFIYHKVLIESKDDGQDISSRESMTSRLHHMASIIAGGEPEEYLGENPEGLLKLLFITILQNHPSEISSEF